MALITKTTIKALLGITDTSKDAIMDATIPVAEEMMCELFGLDELEEKAYEKEVVTVYIDRRTGDFYFAPNRIPVTSIDEIRTTDGDVLTATSDITKGAPLTVHLESDSVDYHQYLEMDYTAGFADEASLPASLKMALSLIVQALITPETNGVASYTIGQTSVSFGSEGKLAQFKAFEEQLKGKYQRIIVAS